MDILSSDLTRSPSPILEQVGLAMLSKSLKGEESQAAELLASLGPAAPLPETSGRQVDLFA